MNMQDALRVITERRDLQGEQMREVMRIVMRGEATPAQIGALLVALRMKGETIEEIAAAAQVMREFADKVKVTPEHLVDTCGTGGDAAHTFNISTASALVAAAAGARVAKHGNRSVSSSSGSADVLEAAGCNLNLSPTQVAQCIDRIAVGFLFAPHHHGATKYAVGPRREMGVRTLFNVLGPLTNPAGAPNQIIGVFAAEWIEPLAKVLHSLGSRHVLVVHSEDGLDEISIGARTHIAELRQQQVRCYTVEPEQFGISRNPVGMLRVHSAKQSLELLTQVLAGTPGPASDVVALNGGAAIYVAGLATSLEEGVSRAQEILASGRAQEKLVALAQLTTELAST